MKDSAEHLGILTLGYLWNHPLQQLNDLLGVRKPDEMDPVLLSALRKLTVEERRALKRAVAGIFAQDMADFCTALDESAESLDGFEIKRGSTHLADHLPPWNDRLSYFDEEGDPKPEYLR
jgi:hypothetical protein